MQKSKIEWCDATWNPTTGCLHGCEYCYARRIAERFSDADKCHAFVGGYPYLRVPDGKGKLVQIHELAEPATAPETAKKSAYPFGFEPTFHRYKLDEPQRSKKPQNIFVCSMADLFGDWVPDSWIEEVFAACEKAPWHRYLFLTKNPKRYLKLAKNGKLPKRETMWYGSTITGPDIPYFVADGYNTFLSIEPLLEPFGQKAEGFSRLGEPRWSILGAMTGPGSKEHQPEKSWVDEIARAADENEIPVFMKDSLISIVGEENMRRELPTELLRISKEEAFASGG